jgi:ribosome maturation factor RimP
MKQAAKNAEADSLKQPLEEVLKGLKYGLVELSVSRQKSGVRIRLVIYNGSAIGTDDCSKVHRAVMPRLELAFEGQDIYLEVSSPGIDRLIKDKAEFAFYRGRGVKCYRGDITEWTAGILESFDEEGIVLQTKEGAVRLDFDNIIKARLESLA